VQITRLNAPKMERQLEQWGTKLDDLAAEAEQAGAAATNGYHELLAELKSKHETATTRLHQLRDAASGQWETHQAEAEHAWHDLERAIGKLAN
jgi:DNA mismatch repair ATPase MutS